MRAACLPDCLPDPRACLFVHVTQTQLRQMLSWGNKQTAGVFLSLSSSPSAAHCVRALICQWNTCSWMQTQQLARDFHFNWPVKLLLAERPLFYCNCSPFFTLFIEEYIFHCRALNLDCSGEKFESICYLFSCKYSQSFIKGQNFHNSNSINKRFCSTSERSCRSVDTLVSDNIVPPLVSRLVERHRCSKKPLS